MSALIIVFLNEKGGTGKTTSAVNLACALHEDGAVVEIIDLDPLANASALFGVRNPPRSIFDALVAPGEAPLPEIQVDIEHGLVLIPGARAMAGIEAAVRNEPGHEMLLKELLEPERERFDYIIIDTPGSLGFAPVMGLVAADVVLMPMPCERLATEGLAQAKRTIQAVKRRLNPNLKTSILLTMKDERYADGHAIEKDLRDQLGAEVLTNAVRSNSKLKLGAPVFDFDATGPAADDHRAVAEELRKIYGSE